jgi:hypothetical protein
VLPRRSELIKVVLFIASISLMVMLGLTGFSAGPDEGPLQLFSFGGAMVMLVITIAMYGKMMEPPPPARHLKDYGGKKPVDLGGNDMEIRRDKPYIDIDPDLDKT